MRTTDRQLIVIARILLFVIYFVGLTGISLPSLSDAYVQLTPFSLLISALILFAFHQNWNKRSVFTMVFIAVGGYFIELLGVQTGAIFGAYTYGQVLGLKMLDVPVIIALNWLLLLYCSYFLSEKLFRSAWAKITLTAILMVVMDLLMEPVAVALNMWSWEGGAPPMQNYVAWFVVSLFFAGLMHFMKGKVKNPVAGYLFFFLVMFFGVLNITL